MSQEMRAGEDGFTLVELVVTVSLLSVVLLTLLTTMASFTSRAAQTEDRAIMLSDTRNAVEAITRDLRAANPIVAIDPAIDVALYDTSVSFSVYCASAGVGTCGTDNQRPVTYRVSGNALEQVIGSTTKVLLGPNGAPAAPATSRQGAVVNSSPQPVFKYFKRDGTVLATSGGTAATSSKIRDCTQYVEIHLVVVAEPGKPTSTINLVTRADLRNFNQVTAC